MGGVFLSSIINKSIIPARAAKYILAAGCIITAYGMWQKDFGLYMPSDLPGVIVAAIGMSATIAGLITLERSGKIPTGNWCLILGKISYPVYISHWMFMELTYHMFWLHHFNVRMHYLIYAAALLAISLGGGTVFAYGVDIPLQKLLKRLFLSPRPARVA